MCSLYYVHTSCGYMTLHICYHIYSHNHPMRGTHDAHLTDGKIALIEQISTKPKAEPRPPFPPDSKSLCTGMAEVTPPNPIQVWKGAGELGRGKLSASCHCRLQTVGGAEGSKCEFLEDRVLCKTKLCRPQAQEVGPTDFGETFIQVKQQFLGIM